MANRNHTLRADLVLLGAALIWGSTFVVVDAAIERVSSLLFNALRFTLALLMLLPVVVVRRTWPSREAWIAGFAVGAPLMVGFALQTVGLEEIGAARSAFLTGLYVVMVPLLLVVVLRRLPAAGSVIGVLLATAGLVLLTGVDPRNWLRGDLLTLGCALSFAVQILAVDRFSRRCELLPLLFAQMFWVALLCWPATLLETPRWVSTPDVWAALLATAFLGSLIAVMAQNYAQRKTTPTRAAVILTMEPVFATVTAFAFAGERFGSGEIAGSILILAGMLVTELWPRAKDAS
ncbi:hypothetical protein ABI59_23850 [Acidobacteria bacterium Mor1]|nr:hypothetical protein ABI59_23850 [Acidobacteria bacterium Mor1]